MPSSPPVMLENWLNSEATPPKSTMENMLKKIGVQSIISSDYQAVLKADKLILPGVGNFKRAMENLHAFGLVDALNQKVLVEKTPIAQNSTMEGNSQR